MAKTIIPRRPLTTSKTDVPGPGAYHPKEMKQGPGFSVGNGPRSNFVSAKNTPGPAQYQHQANFLHPKTSWSIGKGARPPITTTKNYEDSGKIEKYQQGEDFRKMKEEQLEKIKQKGPKAGWTLVGRKNEGTAGMFDRPVRFT